MIKSQIKQSAVAQLSAITGGMTPSEIGGAISSIGRKKNGVVIFGDSITYQNFYNPTANEDRWSSRGYFSVSNYRLGWAFELLNNAGVSGERTDHMLARIKTDVLDYEPAITIVFGGTNDLIQSVSPSIVVQNLTEIYEMLRISGSRVIACTVPVMTGSDANDTQEVNRGIVAYCAENGVDVVDFAAAYLDANNAVAPYQKTGVTSDGIHPGRLGAAYLADRLTPALSKYVKDQSIIVLQNNYTKNKMNNTLNTGTSGAVPNGSAPDDWLFYTAGANTDVTYTGSIVDRGDYNEYVVTQTNTGSSPESCTIYKSGTVSSGKYRLYAEVDFSGINVDKNSFYFRFRSGSSIIKSATFFARDYPESVSSVSESGAFNYEFEVTESVDNVVFGLEFEAVEGVVKFGRVSVIELE